MRNNRGVRPHFTFSECTSNTCHDTVHDSEDPFERGAPTCRSFRVGESLLPAFPAFTAHVQVPGYQKSVCQASSCLSGNAKKQRSNNNQVPTLDSPNDPVCRSLTVPATAVISRPTRTGTGPLDTAHYIEWLWQNLLAVLARNIRSQRKMLFYLC